MNGHEDPLAAIPTEQLVLTLLRELAARVEQLETKVDAGRHENRRSSASKLAHDVDLDLDCGKDKDRDRCSTPQVNIEELPSSSTEPNSIDETSLVVPYGYLLDGEDPSVTVRRPSDRLMDLSTVNPEVAELLRQLGGIVQVPADFRYELTNFWTLDGLVQKGILHGAIEFLDALEQNGGNYWITDHDLKSNQVHYEYGFTPKHSLEASVANRSVWARKEKYAPWRRVM